MNDKRIPTKTYLEESELPRYWYNINAILKEKHAPAFRHPQAIPQATADICR